MNFSKKQTNEFVFTTMRRRRVFVRFLEEIEDTKKTFVNHLTFMRKEDLKTSKNRWTTTTMFFLGPPKPSDQK